MTFAARQHTGSSAPTLGVQSLGTMVLEGNTPSSLSKTASLTLNTDGTISYVNQMADPVYSSVPSNWYLLTTAGIGTNYRVRFSLQSGQAWATGLSNGVFYTLDAARSISWTLAPTAQVSSIVLVEITAVGNGTVLGSGMLYINLVSDY